MMDRYFVDFYDMIDGWVEEGFPSHSNQFDDLEEAKKFADQKQNELDQNNKDVGEHYGVINTETGVEVYCTMKRLKL